MTRKAVQKVATGTLVVSFLYGLALVFQIGVGPVVYAASSTHTVVIEGMKFVPETITVKQGDTIVWVNKDLFPHTATAPGVFDSGELAVNQTWKYIVSKPGKFSYNCTLHPTMQATLVVE